MVFNVRKAAFIAASALVSIAAVEGNAAAQDVRSRGFYVAADVGAALPKQSNISGMGINASADFDTGWGGAAALGYQFERPFRTEFELGYRRAQVNGSGGMAQFGDADVASGMANAFYDFQNSSRFTPYLGLGLGIASVDFNQVGPFGTAQIDDTTTSLAYQGILGVGWHLSDSIDVYTDYRYFAATNPNFTTSSGTSVEGEYAEHRLSLGIRWSFGVSKHAAEARRPLERPTQQQARSDVAPVAEFETAAGGETEPSSPAPPRPIAEPAQKLAAAEPPSAKNPNIFRVYFGWNDATLDTKAMTIVRMAALEARNGGAARIEATGHADRSGPASYNLKLSMRRAESVRDELINLGVASNDIAIYWKGESQPAVPTADGVREPRNRRVVIVVK